MTVTFTKHLTFKNDVKKVTQENNNNQKAKSNNIDVTITSDFTVVTLITSDA